MFCVLFNECDANIKQNDLRSKLLFNYFQNILNKITNELKLSFLDRQVIRRYLRKVRYKACQAT